MIRTQWLVWSWLSAQQAKLLVWKTQQIGSVNTQSSLLSNEHGRWHYGYLGETYNSDRVHGQGYMRIIPWPKGFRAFKRPTRTFQLHDQGTLTWIYLGLIMQVGNGEKRSLENISINKKAWRSRDFRQSWRKQISVDYHCD